MQTLHGSRDRLVAERIALINQLRAIVLERGDHRGPPEISVMTRLRSRPPSNDAADLSVGTRFDGGQFGLLVRRQPPDRPARPCVQRSVGTSLGEPVNLVAQCLAIHAPNQLNRRGSCAPRRLCLTSLEPLARPRSSPGEKSVRNFTGAGMARILPAPMNHQLARSRNGLFDIILAVAVQASGTMRPPRRRAPKRKPKSSNRCFAHHAASSERRVGGNGKGRPGPLAPRPKGR
jgi:hypothetical protein